MKDTARIAVGMGCNLDCSYCCNKLPSVESKWIKCGINGLQLHVYHTVCVTGGEPLLYSQQTESVIAKAHGAGCFVVLYTNGILLTPKRVGKLKYFGLDAINVGLHHPSTFEQIVKRSLDACMPHGVPVRFAVQDIYEIPFRSSIGDLPASYKTWHMNDCERDNEVLYRLEA